ncbi:MAG: serine hydrolase domain-containing protein [Pseudomonadota bacterium]
MPHSPTLRHPLTSLRRATAVLALFATVTTAAQSATPLVLPGSPAAQAAPGPTEKSGTARTVARLVPAMERYVANLMRREEIPGLAVVIADRDRVLYARGFGVREAGKSDPVTARTVFQIGSITKGFLATTTAIAVDSGKLAWDTPLVQRYPGFALKDPWLTQQVSAADVLSHSVGLQSYVHDDMIFLGYPLADRLRAAAQAPLTAPFRQRPQYVNLLHPVVGAVAAQATGEADWDALVARRIFGPLNMSDSSTTREALLAAANHASPHQHLDGKLQVVASVGSYWSSLGVGPAGSINSSARDMGQWLRLQLGRGAIDGQRIVSQANMDETWRPRTMVSPTAGGALGWGVMFAPQGRRITHEGGTASYGANAMILPEAGIGIAVLSNHQQEGLPFALSQWIADRIAGLPAKDYRAGFRRSDTPAPPAAAEAVDTAPLDGRYLSGTLGPITITRQQGQLVMQLEIPGARLRLVPTGALGFSAEVMAEGRFRELVDEGFSPIYQLQFEPGPEGGGYRATAVSPQGIQHTFVKAPG